MRTEQLRRTVSLILALALMLWAEAVPAINPSTINMRACHGMSHKAMHPAYHCCPQQLPAASSLPEPSFTTISSFCQQNCCTVRRQPVPRLTFLASGNRSLADSTHTCVGAIAIPPATVFEDQVVHSPSFAKAVFDLKTDLRI
jgi:hypothetical protein